MFLDKQTAEQRDKYIKLLAGVGSLSKLFSDSQTPFLYYRAHENIFCLSLDADNKARGDYAVDAVKDGVGVGLKTFVGKNSQYEKVAEFNRMSSEYKNLKSKELVTHISIYRNDRIDFSYSSFGLKDAIYHCVARESGKFRIFETSMDSVDIDNIRVTKASKNVLSFNDGKNDYKFNTTKSTLYKKFKPHSTFDFSVEILDDPYKLFLGEANNPHVEEVVDSLGSDMVTETVVLPLYSLRGGVHVPERSGLNQWNAEGRERDESEVYIPVPIWIHRVFPDFFPSRDTDFKLRLPDGKIMISKICQSNGKALMSNPNKELGDWLLRKVLKLDSGELLTYEHLMRVGLDSVEITKQYTEENDPFV
jgi:hypothetical protein